MRVPDQDLRIDTYRTGDSSVVKLTHLPTGIIVTSDAQPTEQQARKQAMRTLKSLLANLPSTR